MINRTKAIFLAIALLIIGGISVFAYAPFNRVICILIALFGLIWINHNYLLNQKSWFKIFLYNYIFALGFFISNLYWVFSTLYNVIATPLIVAVLALIAFAAFLAIYTALVMLLFNYLYTKSLEFNYLFLLPSIWTLGEWLRGWLLTGFSWYDISYTQINNYLLSGIFPVLGGYGVSWISLSVIGFLYLVLFNNKILLSTKLNLTMANRLAIVYFTALAVTGYFLHGKQYTTNYGAPVKVALLQGNISAQQKWDIRQRDNILNVYKQLISQANADIIIVPETAISDFMENLPANYIDNIVNLAKQNNTQIIAGMMQRIDESQPGFNYVNAAVVLTNPEYPYYAKAHLVPYGEYIPLKSVLAKVYKTFDLPKVGFSHGSPNQLPIVVGNQKVAFNICYENGFGAELLENARNSTLMINLSEMVWYGDAITVDQHLQLSQARALENQRYFIQATNSGISAIINPNGQIQAQLPKFQRQILTDYVQGKVGETPYQKYGNYPIIILSTLLILFGIGFRLRLSTLKNIA